MTPTSTQMVAGWLQQADWRAIAAHLQAQGASSAIEFKARALLRIQTTRGAVDWDAAIADLVRACELEPEDASHWSNLCQASLDARRPDQAFTAARRALLLAPAAMGVVEKVMVSSAVTGRQAEALEMLRELRAEGLESRGIPPAFLDQAIEDLESRWWEPVRSGSICLRLVRAGDEPFLERLFADREFMRQYNIFQGTSPEAVRTFVDLAQRLPRISGQIDWIIEDASGVPLGIAGLARIDLVNRRAEPMLGYPGTGRGLKKLAAAVAIMEFAFGRLGLHKLVSHVYATNVASQQFTLGLGFRQEGLLREHVRTGPDANWIDLYVNGMLRDDYLSSRYRREKPSAG